MKAPQWGAPGFFGRVAESGLSHCPAKAGSFTAPWVQIPPLPLGEQTRTRLRPVRMLLVTDSGVDANRESLAWAAGLFEGEGCLTTYLRSSRPGGRKYRAAELSIYSTDPDVLRTFHRIVGVGQINRHRRSETVGKPAEHVQAVVAALWPWLHSRRRARIVEVLQLMR
jgi:hypothetical protein